VVIVIIADQILNNLLSLNK